MIPLWGHGFDSRDSNVKIFKDISSRYVRPPTDDRKFRFSRGLVRSSLLCVTSLIIYSLDCTAIPLVHDAWPNKNRTVVYMGYVNYVEHLRFAANVERDEPPKPLAQCCATSLSHRIVNSKSR